MARKNSVPYLVGTSFYRMAYVEFGNPAAPCVVCVHGLTRNGRDFDPLAEALAERFHVVCPDLPGRGLSDWLPDGAMYQPASYVAALAHLLAAINKPVMWVGTSLGGICGMMVAAAGQTPVTRMVLNDIGPFIPEAALRRIRDYMLGAPERFPTMRALEAHLRNVHAPFGALTDAQWQHLAKFSARNVLDVQHGGAFALHYDPKIIEPIRDNEPQAVDMWGIWEKINVPVLTIRGEHSDLLLPETYARMKDEGAEIFTVPHAGHAPALMDEPSIAAVAGFLEA